MKILYFLFFSFLFVDCRKMVEAPQLPGVLDNRTVFANDDNADAAMRGVYSEVMNNLRGPFNGDISILAGLSSDELKRVSSFAIEDSFYLNRVNPGNSFNTNLYAGAYRMINSANSILDALAGANGVSKGKAQQLIGEAKFCRAFGYFYLSGLYGDVPLVTTSLFLDNKALPRSAISDVFRQVRADLRDAQQLLPEAYIVTGGDATARTRPNKAAAMALLARIYLYMEKWDSAESLATAVLSDRNYQLEDLAATFAPGSREAIWQLQPVYGQMATADGFLFLPAGINSPNYMLMSPLLDAFEPGDQRKSLWTKTITVLGHTYTIPFKYKQRSYVAGSSENEMVIRLAELFLIRAEARVHNGDPGGAAADLSTVRSRAGLPNTSGSDAAALLDAIFRERQVELFTEWGHRWMDLKRTKRADAILGMEKAGWEPVDALYPLPAADLLTNLNLIQNPGY